MNPNEDLAQFVKQYSEMMARLSEVIKEPIKQFQDFQVAIGATISKIEIPAIEIDWERIKTLTEHNSSHGWTLTGDMSLSFYLNDELLQLKQEEIDELFVEYFEHDSKKNYNILKSNILDEIDVRWKTVLEDCFELYEQDKYKVIIPMLMSIVEGEISGIAESNAIGRKLFNEWEGQILSKDGEFTLIVSHSLYQYLSSDLFGRKMFIEERGSMLNRNWVLHGRDNPDYWTKIDALKLINVIETLQVVKSE